MTRWEDLGDAQRKTELREIRARWDAAVEDHPTSEAEESFTDNCLSDMGDLFEEIDRLRREQDAAAVLTDDELRDQVAKAVCSIAIGSERVETVMEIIQEHTAKAELRAEAAEGQLDDIRQWCHDWSADQWAARAILDRIGWPEVDQAHQQRHQREGGGA